MLDLPKREICIYVLYRIEELMALGVATSYNEIRYNICEVGPGKRRLDPWSLDIVIKSKFFGRLSTLSQFNQNEILFFVKESSSSGLVGDDIIKLKTSIIGKIQEIERSNEVYIKLQELIKNTVDRSNSIIMSFTKNSKETYVECQVHHSDVKDWNLLIRFYNIERWLYPDSHEIWSLFAEAFRVKSIPVLIAPRIHGSCFQLFKSIGMFARANYYIFMPDTLSNIISSMVTAEEKSILDLSGFKLGRYENIKSELAYGEFDILKKLLSVTIPQYHTIFCENLVKRFKKLIPLLNEASNDFFAHTNQARKEMDRVKAISKFIEIAKLGRILEIKKMIKRNQRLIKSLQHTTR